MRSISDASLGPRTRDSGSSRRCGARAPRPARRSPGSCPSSPCDRARSRRPSPCTAGAPRARVCTSPRSRRHRSRSRSPRRGKPRTSGARSPSVRRRSRRSSPRTGGACSSRRLHLRPGSRRSPRTRRRSRPRGNGRRRTVRDRARRSIHRRRTPRALCTQAQVLRQAGRLAPSSRRSPCLLDGCCGLAACDRRSRSTTSLQRRARAALRGERALSRQDPSPTENAPPMPRASPVLAQEDCRFERMVCACYPAGAAMGAMPASAVSAGACGTREDGGQRRRAGLA